MQSPVTQPINRHNDAHYYAHRVRESLTTRVSKTLCIVFLSLLLVSSIVLFILYISLRPHRPRIFIHEFSIPGPSQPTGFEDAKITFKAAARNSNQHVGIHYDSVVVGTVYYKRQRVGSTSLSHPFFQHPDSTEILDGTLSGAKLNVTSRRWAEFVHHRRLGKISFRLSIKSAIRFHVFTWGSRRHTMHANCVVVVGSDGVILPAYKDKTCPLYFT